MLYRPQWMSARKLLPVCKPRVRSMLRPDLGAQRKDIPTRGSLGDAELAGLELEREAHEEQNRKQDARQNDAFFNTQLKTNWSQRAAQLRQNINALYARERDAERMAAQAKAAAVPAAPSP